MHQPAQINSVAILGLGNVLMQDDGVGVHVVRQMQGAPPPGAVVFEIGTTMLGHLAILEEYEVIIAVDAVCAGGAPGSIYLLAAQDARLTGNDSLHDLGLAGALRLIDPLRQPRQVVVVGVEPLAIDYRLELSEPVQRILPEIIRCVEDQVTKQIREFPVQPPVS